MSDEAVLKPWRAIGKQIYAQMGDTPAPTDWWLGTMEDDSLAREVIESHNKCLEGDYVAGPDDQEDIEDQDPSPDDPPPEPAF